MKLVVEVGVTGWVQKIFIVGICMLMHANKNALMMLLTSSH